MDEMLEIEKALNTSNRKLDLRQARRKRDFPFVHPLNPSSFAIDIV